MSRSVVAAVVVLAVLLVALLGPTLAGAGKSDTLPSREDRVVKTDEAWKQELTGPQYYILREKGTERAFTSAFNHDHAPGTFVCAACGLELFASDAKFDSGTGWPSFYQPIAKDRIDELTDTAFGMIRTEVTCARCGGHLGHVFRDGPPPTGLRYCINGEALDKVPAAGSAQPPTTGVDPAR